MDTIVYSIPAMVFEHGKNVKGYLNLYEDRYEFNKSKIRINWEKASYKKDVQETRTFLFKSEKPVIIIYEGKDYGPRFILEKDMDNALVAEIDKLAEITKGKRLKAEAKRKLVEEEEHKRKEFVERWLKEEERKRKEEEERKREEEEERKRKEEEERKRRAEEERKRKEEEERKRKEEEERKRRAEEERKRKEEEEQKRKEALARKISERQQRIQTAINHAGEQEFPQVQLSDNPDSSIRKAWSFIAENPYRVLGVSVAATADEANSSLDKIKKLSRLNATASFKTEYQLNGTDKPERDISIVQNALTSLKCIEHKWFWFADSDACASWQDEQYRKELNTDGFEYATYDLFLANYLYALIFDSHFEDEDQWKNVFAYIDYLCTEASISVLKSRFNEKELQSNSDYLIRKSFEKEIFKPVEAICEGDNSELILRVYACVKNDTGSKTETLKKSIASKLSKWFSSKEEEICLFLKPYSDMDSISASTAKEVNREGKAYLQQTESALEKALVVLKDEQVRYDMVKESFRNATWQIMFVLNKAEDKKNAISFANKCYPYCSEDDKRKIRNTFGFTAIKGCSKDVTNAEWDIMGDNYYNGANGYAVDYDEAFKWYNKAANAGNRYSQNSLGICYKTGRGTYQSDYEAAKWFEKAYRNGNADGAYNLAVCYAKGSGRVQDKSKAVDLYLEAAKLGHPTAAKEGKNLLDLMILEQKRHRLLQHEHYDLGYQSSYPTVIVEVTLNYSANVYLLDNEDYRKYKNCDNFSYYGGKATQSPYRIKIPNSGFWHLVIDNGDDDMTGIITNVHTRTLNF